MSYLKKEQAVVSALETMTSRRGNGFSEKVPYFLPPLSGPTSDEVSAAENVLKSHKAAKEAQLQGTLMTCVSQAAISHNGCGAVFAIADATYVQTHWERGDHWAEGEGQVRCPRCKNLVRLYDTAFLQTLRAYFKSREDSYPHRLHFFSGE